jgi:hypothetical protein
MNKKEKYYNYVVNDLVSKTEIDNERKENSFPYLPSPTKTSVPPLFSLPSRLFSKHVIERYGTHDGEIKIIWNLYKERIHSLIK